MTLVYSYSLGRCIQTSSLLFVATSGLCPDMLNIKYKEKLHCRLSNDNIHVDVAKTLYGILQKIAQLL